MPDRGSTYARGVASVAAGSLAVELLPEGTHRLGSRTPIGPRLAHVVDSTPTVRSITRTLLEVHGFEVEAFAGLDAAAQRCAARMPDVVVMEPHDREADALDVLRRWHAQVASPHPPVVWCTTVTPTQGHLSTGALLSLRGVVIKPFRLEALAALVVRVVRTHERERELLDLGVDLRRVTGPLSAADTGAWLGVESRLAEEHGRPLSMVVVDSATPEVMLAMRSVIRSVDLLARLDQRTSAVLLPDVDVAGAAVVAHRTGNAVTVIERVPVVRAVTRYPGEPGEAFLERALRRR
ncbi:MAG TPA: response regulator [Candidatus Dormibacteraeota bacterium]|jgi:two-component system chemotaxis response regulator CheY|nr:response regulator [Candidatus Dormibacteraeota bacterium]